MKTNYSINNPVINNQIINFKLSNTDIDNLKDGVDIVSKKNDFNPATVFSPSELKSKLDKEVRSSFRYSTRDTILEELLLNTVLPIISENSSYNFELIKNHFDVVMYKEGGKFNKHQDYSWYYAPNRIQMTILIGLNDIKTGGTQVWFPDNYSYESNEKLSWADIASDKPKPKIFTKIFTETARRGGVLIFPSNWYHSGLEVSGGEKMLLMATLSLDYSNIINDQITNKIPNKISPNLDNLVIFNTVDDREIYIDPVICKGTSLEEIINSNKLNSKSDVFKVNYPFNELSLILKYLGGRLLSNDEWVDCIGNDTAINSVFRDITGIDNKLIHTLLNSGGVDLEYGDLKTISELINGNIELSIWSDFKKWMPLLVELYPKLIPFYIINEITIAPKGVDEQGEVKIETNQTNNIVYYNGEVKDFWDREFPNTDEEGYMDRREYNWNRMYDEIIPPGLLDYEDFEELSKSQVPKKLSFKLFVDNIIRITQNNHHNPYWKYNHSMSEENPDELISNSILYDHLNDYIHYKIPENSEIYKQFINIENNIKTILSENNELNIPKKFSANISNSKSYKYLYEPEQEEYRKPREERSNNSWCNGRDYGGHKDENLDDHKNIPTGYEKQIITIRYGLYKLLDNVCDDCK